MTEVLTFVHLFDKDCGYDGASVRGTDFKGVKRIRMEERIPIVSCRSGFTVT